MENILVSYIYCLVNVSFFQKLFTFRKIQIYFRSGFHSFKKHCVASVMRETTFEIHVLFQIIIFKDNILYFESEIYVTL